MNRKTTKKVDESTLTTLCAVCRGGIFGRKGRPAPQSRPQAARQGCLHVLPDTIWV